jgi:drug/metabolite transporter (DMT)-like permease
MGHLKIITAILIWSSLGIFVRKIGVPTIRIIFYPATVAGIFQLLLLSLGTKGVKHHGPMESRHLVYLLLLPVFFLANMFLFFFAFRHTTIANAVFTHYTAPIFVALLAPVFLKEGINKGVWIAIILSSIGLWLMVGTVASNGDSPFDHREVAGIVAGLLSGVAYAFLILIIRKIAHAFSPLFILFVQNSIVSIILLPFVINTPHPLNILPYMLIMGVIHSTLAPLLYIDGMRGVRASEAAILGYLEPVGAVLLAMVFLQEVPGITALVGGLLILYSGIITIRGGRIW